MVLVILLLTGYVARAASDDSDGDGLSDEEELDLDTDPDNPDTDGDGLEDGEEVNQYQTDPCQRDTDGDHLDDGAEVNDYHTDPNNPDTDGGTVYDGFEVANGTDPLDPSDDILRPERYRVAGGHTLGCASTPAGGGTCGLPTVLMFLAALGCSCLAHPRRVRPIASGKRQ